ncbi:MAG: hypothetical protein E7069_12255 [Bacteroidales bacterium]|nr:hypothetical protein [Bacteroidales bacterium]
MKSRDILKSATTLLLLSATFVTAYSQVKITGKIIDGSNNQPLPSATILLTNDNGQQFGQTTDADGVFSFSRVKAGKYKLKMAFLGYIAVEKSVEASAADVNIGTIKLELENKNLAEVKAVAEVVRQEQRGDTIIFNAAAFKVNPDATTADLLKKMPGMQVKDGTVTQAGETIKKVLVDGEEFFGSDPMIALKTIDASMVDKIEVYDKQSDQSEFTGFSDGNEERTINILTKMGVKKGRFGRAYGGYGTGEHYEMGGNMNFFAGLHRLSVIGMLNNVNQQSFSFDDVTGAMAAGGRGMTGSFGGGRDGLNTTGALGINYNYSKKNKLKIAASYFYNYNKNQSNSGSVQEYFTDDDDADSLHVYDSQTQSDGKNFNHRANLRLNWTINSNNSLVFDPNISWQIYKQNRFNTGADLLNAERYKLTTQNNDNKTIGYGLGGNLTWRHKFSIDKRTISLRVGSTVNNSDADGVSSSSIQDDNNDANSLMTSQLTDNESRSNKMSASLMYTEPFGNNAVLQLNYSPTYTHSSGNKYVMADSLLEVTDAPEFNNYQFSQLLSTKKESNYLQHKAGIGLNIFNTKEIERGEPGEERGQRGMKGEGREGGENSTDKVRVNATIGLDFQKSILDGNQTYPYSFETHKTYNSLLPSAEFRIRKNKDFNLRLIYRTSTKAPSISNLQKVVDVSNVRKYTAGNPDLDQSLTHQIRFRVGINNTATSRFMFVSSELSATRDYIATSTVIATQDSLIDYGITLPKGTQLSKPINMNGYLTSRINMTLSSPVKWLASNVSLNLGANFNKTPSLYNYRKVTNKTYSFSGGVNIGSNISENIDFNVNYDGSYNIVKSTKTVANNYNYYKHSAGADLTWLFFDQRFVFTNSLSHTYTSGMGDDYDSNYLTWNASFGYKFFADRRAELKLRANDILNSAESVRRSIQDAYIQTSTTDVLKRYVMLTFTYKFKTIGEVPQQRERQGGRGGRGGMGGPM